MSGFENYSEETRQLETALVRKGIALGIDWNDAIAVDQLARDALDFKPGNFTIDHHYPRQIARFEIFGIAELMLRVMAESANDQILSHGGNVWKAFSRALWRARQTRTEP
jgi:hypothetical protein